MTLKIANTKFIQDCLLNPSFVFFANKVKLPLPKQVQNSYAFNDVVDETAFILAYKGFDTAINLSLNNDIGFMRVDTDFENVKTATLNQYFMHEARKQDVPLPTCNLANYNKFKFKNEFDEMGFKMFYLGWRSGLNMCILNVNNPKTNIIAQG